MLHACCETGNTLGVAATTLVSNLVWRREIKCTEAGDPHNVEKIVFVSLTVMMVDLSTTPFTGKSVEDLVDIYL